MKKEYKIVIGALLIAAVAFFGGSKFGEAKTAAPASQGQYPGARGGQGGSAARTRFAGATAGTIISKDDTSVTIQLQSGGTRIVFLGASTTIQKLAPATTADLVAGQTVLVSGTPNSDGSVTASSIDLRPLPMNRTTN